MSYKLPRFSSMRYGRYRIFKVWTRVQTTTSTERWRDFYTEEWLEETTSSTNSAIYCQEILDWKLTEEHYFNKAVEAAEALLNSDFRNPFAEVKLRKQKTVLWPFTRCEKMGNGEVLIPNHKLADGMVTFIVVWHGIRGQYPKLALGSVPKVHNGEFIGVDEFDSPFLKEAAKVVSTFLEKEGTADLRYTERHTKSASVPLEIKPATSSALGDALAVALEKK